MGIYVAEGMHEEGKKILRAEGFHLYEPQDTFLSKDIVALIVRSVFMVDLRCLEQFSALRVVAKLGTGLDNIDQNACRNRSMKIVSAPGMNSVSAAEFTVVQFFNILKNSFMIYDAVRVNDLRRETYYGRKIASITVAVIGYGSVGKNIVERLKPFVKELVVVDPVQKLPLRDGNVRFLSSITEAFEVVDAALLAVPLAGNEQMVDAQLLSRVGKGFILVNTARGGVIDEAAVAEFLRKDPTAFYYFDTVENEPDYALSSERQMFRHPFTGLSNVLFTPHIAGMTYECQRDIAVKVARDIAVFLKEK